MTFDEMVNGKSYYAMLIFLTAGMCLQRIAMGPSSVCMGVSVAIFLWMLYKHWDVACASWENPDIQKYVVYFVMFVIGITPSLFGPCRFSVSLREYFNLAFYHTLPFLIVVTFVKEKKILYGMLMVYLVLEGIECGVAIWQTLTNYNGAGTRGDGFTSSGLFIPGMLCYTIPIATIICVDKNFYGKLKYLAYGVLPIFICTVFTNRSRMGFLVFILIFFGIVGYYSRRSKTILKGMVASIVVIGFVTLNTPSLLARFNNGFDVTGVNTSNYARILLWQSSYNMTKDYPITGVGLGNWKDAYKAKYKSPKIIRIGAGHLAHAHSSYMQMVGQAGWPGVVGMIMFHFGVVLLAFRDWSKCNNVYSGIILFMWMAEILFGLVEPVFIQSCQIKNLMWLTGIIMVLGYMEVTDGKA